MRLVATALLVSSAVYLGLGGRRQEAGGRRQGGGKEVGKSQPALQRQQLTTHPHRDKSLSSLFHAPALTGR